MNQIKIVMYDHTYAESLADMWNQSGQNWGGEQAARTTEDVINENEKMGNICAFLALDGEEVVGYCSFSEYKQDEGASYIPLLNVRTDHIGKKIGKTLVKECVKKAMQSKWPRLDLYTWQGNDKAVPVYKKCGFFWERRDGSTHLMNFMPYVMGTEAVKEYFDTFDWYDDSVREIKIESDGRSEGDFEYYEYNWEKDDITLKMEFEKNGRGLTCIETDDYIIKARVDKKDLVVGKSYEVEYECINKSGKELDIEIRGIEDKNIKNHTEYKGSIKNSEIIKGEFFLDTMDEEQDKYRTHPCVTSIITINGLDATFKVGVYPNFPIKMEIANQKEFKKLEKEISCYFNIENNFDEDIDIEFTLIDDEWISFKDKEQTCSLKAKGKKSLELLCILSDYGFYSKEIEVTIRTSTEVIKHKLDLRGAFIGCIGKYHGEDERSYSIYNGQYCMSLIKKDNATHFTKIGAKGDNGIFLRAPQIGKPYTIELFNKKANSVSFISKTDSEIIKATYELEDFKNIVLDYYVELYQNGIAKTYCEIKNISDSYTYKELVYCQRAFYLLNDALIPIDNKIVRTPNLDGLLTKQWDFNKVSENWIFSDWSKCKTGIGWHKGAKVNFDEVFVIVDSEINNLLPKESFITEPVTYTIDTFESWQEFRKYMGYTKEISNEDMYQSFECRINNNNPFVENIIEVEFEEIKKIPVNGSANISSENQLFGPISKELKFIDNKSKVECPNENRADMDILKIDVNLDFKDIHRKRVVFFKDTNEVKTNKYLDQGKEVYELDNGLIKIKASPEFSVGIYSLMHRNNEWLDNSFPEPAVKSWWNYWTGGYGFISQKLSFASLFKEKKKAEFVSLEDNAGNIWSGIKTTLEIKENEEFKGISIDQYFLLLPGVPVLCDFPIIRQNSPKYMEDHPFEQIAFIKQGENLEDNWVAISDRGEKTIYKCGKTEFDLFSNDFMVHGSNNTEFKMIHLIDKNDKVGFGNTNGISVENHEFYISGDVGTSIKRNPSFIVFSKEDLDDVMLEDLYKISFNVL
ncbi:hypothetical protein AN1V17_25560 [Vallitalea sediminicola]